MTKIALILFLFNFPFLSHIKANTDAAVARDGKSAFYGGAVSQAEAETGGACATCDDCLTAATTAASGMDPTNLMLMAQAGNTIVEGAKAAGGSARAAHKGNAGIQGFLGILAMNQYRKCQIAISACTSKCDPAGLTPDERRNQGANSAELAKCKALQTPCGQAALQGLLALAQAGISLAIAKNLGDEDDDDDDDDNEDPPPTPLTLKPGSDSVATQGYASSFTGDATTASPGSGPSAPPPAPSTQAKAKDKGDGKGLPVNQPNPSLGSTDAFTGLSPSNASSGLERGGKLSPSSISKGFGRDRRRASKKSGSGRSRAYNSGSKRGGSHSSFAGGSDSEVGLAPAPPESEGGRGLSSGTNKKVALNEKGLEQANKLKRSAFSSAGAHESIFEKMSRVIQSFCSVGSGKCASTEGLSKK